MTVYNIKNRSNFYSRLICTVLHGTESFPHLGPKIWELVPSDMKNLSSLTPSKKNGRHILIHVGFVEPTSVRFVFFSLSIQNQLFLLGFLVLPTHTDMRYFKQLNGIAIGTNLHDRTLFCLRVISKIKFWILLLKNLLFSGATLMIFLWFGNTGKRNLKSF